MNAGATISLFVAFDPAAALEELAAVLDKFAAGSARYADRSNQPHGPGVAVARGPLPRHRHLGDRPTRCRLPRPRYPVGFT